MIRKGDSPNEAMALAVLLCSNGILCGMAKDAEAAVTRRQQELEYAEEELKTMNIAVEKMERKAAELETEKRRVKRRVKKLEKVLWRRVEGLE